MNFRPAVASSVSVICPSRVTLLCYLFVFSLYYMFIFFLCFQHCFLIMLLSCIAFLYFPDMSHCNVSFLCFTSRFLQMFPQMFPSYVFILCFSPMFPHPCYPPVLPRHPPPSRFPFMFFLVCVSLICFPSVSNKCYFHCVCVFFLFPFTVPPSGPLNVFPPCVFLLCFKIICPSCVPLLRFRHVFPSYVFIMLPLIWFL